MNITTKLKLHGISKATGVLNGVVGGNFATRKRYHVNTPHTVPITFVESIRLAYSPQRFTQVTPAVRICADQASRMGARHH